MIRKCEAPIFVRGMSRSGGTLAVTLLDAHREISMSYELYPDMLKVEEPTDMAALANLIGSSSSMKVAATRCPTDRFRVFLIRCARGGMDHTDFADGMRRLIEEGLDFSDMTGRMRMIELCGELKMERNGCQFWGMKCSGSYDDYLSIWPKARFIDVLRDGRDVLASQLHALSSNPAPEKVATSWLNTHQRFEKLQSEIGNQAYMVRYEELAHHPEAELRRICKFLDLEFDPAMTHHNDQDLTIYQANHISRKRVEKAIDTSMIGRWKNDLTQTQADAFMSVAGDGLKHFGYE